MEREFPTVEELSNGFSEFRLPQITKFVGKKISLFYENGDILKLAFLNDKVLHATSVVNGKEESIAAEYIAVEPRENIYFIDYIASFGDTKSITSIVDFNKNIATTLIGTLPSNEELAISQFERGKNALALTSVKTTFLHASVDTEYTSETKKHEFTRDLIGERIAFKYSQNDTYEHIYLNDKYYTWHCISGVEKGLCDTDRCFYLKLDTDLYWFVWMERIVPTIGTVVEDLAEDKMRSYGKIFGYEQYEVGKVINFAAGSYASKINKVQ